MPQETLPAYAALMEACKGAGLQAKAVEVFGGRRVPLDPTLTIVYEARA